MIMSTRSTPSKEKIDSVAPVKMKRKLVKKAQKDVEGSVVASASENVKAKGKKVDDTGLKRRRLAFDAVLDPKKVEKSLHIEEPTRFVQNRLIDTYFPNSEVTRDGLGVIFLNKVFKLDEDAVKLAVIYYVV
ncbi:uncharacterized protein LOC126667135 [Mercurialis annua]|uniref:uncharacterized protein LOC126667135 n=1 Tax=Mercurialis annua TaxID=3986 RepID=UPI0024AD6718|nr:uncharacterized protein LOC126667135 [Mercurialis annua]